MVRLLVALATAAEFVGFTGEGTGAGAAEEGASDFFSGDVQAAETAEQMCVGTFVTPFKTGGQAQLPLWIHKVLAISAETLGVAQSNRKGGAHLRPPQCR